MTNKSPLVVIRAFFYFFFPPGGGWQYYPEIDTCLCEKDGDLQEKQKELKLVMDEDFSNSVLGAIR
jgi:hypothetical protein